MPPTDSITSAFSDAPGRTPAVLLELRPLDGMQRVLDRQPVQTKDLSNPGHLGLAGLVQADGHELAGLPGLNRLADPLQVVRPDPTWNPLPSRYTVLFAIILTK
jgi:hypothetical protein